MNKLDTNISSIINKIIHSLIHGYIREGKHTLYDDVIIYLKDNLSIIVNNAKNIDMIFFQLPNSFHIVIKDKVTNELLHNNIPESRAIKTITVPILYLLQELKRKRKLKIKEKIKPISKFLSLPLEKQVENLYKENKYKNDVLTPSDITLLTELQEIELLLTDEDKEIELLLTDEDKEIINEIYGGTKEALQDIKTKPFLYYLMCIIPQLTEFYFDTKYDYIIEKRIWTNNKAYQTDFNNFINFCVEHKIPKTNMIKNVLSGNKRPFGEKEFQNLIDFLVINKQKIRQVLTKINKDSLRYFSRVYKVITSPELPIDDLEYISLNLSGLLDRNIILLLKSMETSVDIQHSLKIAIQNEELNIKYLLGTSRPTPTQLINFAKKDPNNYKAWRKLGQITKKFSKLVLEQEWINLNYGIEPVAKAIALCKKLDIPCPIDKGFKGKIGLGITQSMLFSYYTKDNEILDSVLGNGVIMNTKYNTNNKTYYCTHMPFISKTGKPIKVYTQNARNLSSQKLHNSAREIVGVIEDVRNTFIEDAKTLEKGTITLTGLRAAVCRMLDLTAGRIGNKSSVRDRQNYGIHNLLCKHISIKDKKVTINYIGKKQVKQKHVIEDVQMIKIIKILKKNRKPSDYLFSVKGDKPINPTAVSSYLKDTGFPGSPHRFRKYHANRIFNEIIHSKEQGKRINVSTSFNLAVAEVAKALGNTPAVCISAYIDPILGKQFFDRHGVEYPKALLNAINKMGNQNPDGDD